MGRSCQREDYQYKLLHTSIHRNHSIFTESHSGFGISGEIEILNIFLVHSCLLLDSVKSTGKEVHTEHCDEQDSGNFEDRRTKRDDHVIFNRAANARRQSI